MDTNWLIINGIRQNNLKNVSLRIPHDKFVVVTGVSGSGKSSLAFDTIFAEGQWRFIESLSSYAKLFLEKLNRPDVDEVLNIRPAIALQQRNPVKGSRSTLGTVTEIYDLLRVMYARVSQPVCPACGEEIRRWDTASTLKELLLKFTGERAMILFETSEPLTSLRERGYYRLFIAGEIKEIFDMKKPDDSNPDATDIVSSQPNSPGSDSPVMVLLDRVVIKDEPRLYDSIELAWREGHGRIKVIVINHGEFVFSDANKCDKCGKILPEPTPVLFSFNHPVGACPKCKGFGNILKYDESLVIPDPSKSLARGAIEPWEKPSFDWWKGQLMSHADVLGLDLYKPVQDFSEEEKKLIYESGKGFYGLNDFFEFMEEKRYKLHVRVFLSRYRIPQLCTECSGKRLNAGALSYKIGGMDIGDVSAMTIGDLYELFKTPSLTQHQSDVADELLRHMMAKLELLLRVGLDYLTLNRQTMTLSGGEFQRINLANQLSARLAGALYVLDEPTVGLHSRDNERVAAIIRELAGQGNTIIVVEHDTEIIGAADWVVELGPGGGKDGGKLVFNGPISEFSGSGTITARYMRQILKPGTGKTRKEDGLPSGTVRPSGKDRHFLTIKGAGGHNLRNIDFTIPLGEFTVVTGVSGSGKSSLVVETMYRAVARYFKEMVEMPLSLLGMEGQKHLKGVTLIDQSPIGRSPRSNPATYVKLFDGIRKVFAAQQEARVYGYGAGFFSFNVAGGRCETCKGEGYQKLEMYFFEDLYVKCEACGGTRYSREALQIKYRGKNVSEVLDLTVDEAISLFSEEPSLVKKLSILREVGLGYLRLGQSATTLSGGEAQRLKICAELGVSPKRHHLYVMDEPTIGLHMHDVTALLGVIGRLIDMENTVVMIEHNLDVVNSADWIVDIGPEGGERGGDIVFEGPPDKLALNERSHTGKSLAKRRAIDDEFYSMSEVLS
ncbi:MAG: excinuclease ABC subunit UvrA [Nitrospirae bacterium]|nr:excinuclease ABC subunit UvrA [Nitrospirota bacterium]